MLVLIVGETARAANFSLGGYARETNAALASRDILYFQNVVSCGTDTATSLPCMFSGLGAEDFSVRKARERENVLDVLLRTGVSVQWLDNNSGCKGVCARVPTQQMPTSGIDGLCGEDACQDEVLTRSLEERLSEVKQDTAIVLHQMGSHGPAYYRRYPAPGKFQPTCDTNRIQSCDRQALVNTYDNTIEYTSQNIARIVEAARARALAMDIAVLYISDHGESLGERNIYLHGLPPMLAPSEQTHVPMLAWLPAQTQDRLKLPLSCLASVTGQKYSHDNLFSTLLGFFGVATAAYRADLDMLAIGRASHACGNAPRRLTLK
ncbi:phosphoethanolamine transferase [Variovorax gossypii]